MKPCLHSQEKRDFMTEHTRKKCRISGVILAAGQARRIGVTKQLLPFRQSTLLGQAIENARNSKLDEIIVVLGHDAASIQNHINFEGINVVVNNDYQLGQSTSLLAGLHHLSVWADAVMYLLGDQPLVDEQVIDTIITAYEDTRSPLIVPMFEGKRGNPVIIDRDLFSELSSTVQGDAGARVLFKQHAGKIHFVELDRRCIHVDVDTMQDYLDLLAIDHVHGNPPRHASRIQGVQDENITSS